MSSILPEETLIVGDWVVEGGRVSCDANEERIRFLIGSSLVRVARDLFGWDALYRDPNDHRLWELTYPRGGMQGGGPLRLECVSPEQVKTKYRL